MTKAIQIRIDSKLKKEADKVFDELGLDTPTAIRMFLNKAVRTRSIPFRLNNNLTENGFTPEFEREIIEAEKSPIVGSFHSAEEAIKFLHKNSK